jgi:peptide deformylase
VRLRADGLFARALQHEIDHLDGVLFIDKALEIEEDEAEAAEEEEEAR